MSTPLILTYTLVAAASVVSPGPATMLAIRNGLSGNFRHVFYGALGNVTGLFCLSAASMLGLSVLLQTSAALFLGVKIVGAAYLFYLGFRHLRGRGMLPPAREEIQPARPGWLYWREACTLAITNPKPILFFGALFPQFLAADEPPWPQFLVLTGIFCALSLISLHGYALLAYRARGALVRPRVIRWLDRTVGSLFVAFGAGLLALRRT
ncbi:LysE family translocator [Bordetella sp. 2513F-2]